METNTTGSTHRKIKQVIAVMSGKGGVGKSVVTGLLASGLQRQGLHMGILDGDLACPAITGIFGIRNHPLLYTGESFEPRLSKDGIKIISMDMFFGPEAEPLVWRGPLFSSAFKQLYSEVDWGELDYLLIDTPSGMSDVPMTVLQSLPLDGVLIVSSPQVMTMTAARKCISMAHQFKHTIFGIIENVAYFMPPSGKYYEPYGPSRSADLVAMVDTPLLAKLALDPVLAALCDAGRIEDYNAEVCETLATNFLQVQENKCSRI